MPSVSLQKMKTEKIVKLRIWFRFFIGGSLYNRFKSKEEILLNIVTDYLERTLDESEEFLGEEINPLIAAVLPGAFEVFISSKDRKIADLIYEVHKLWATVEILTDISRTFDAN